MRPKTKNHSVEINRRGAAALANATAGRSRAIDSKKVYDRKTGKKVQSWD